MTPTKHPTPPYRAAVAALQALFTSDGVDAVSRCFAEATGERHLKLFVNARKVKPVTASLDALAMPGAANISEWKSTDGSRRFVSQPYGLDLVTLKALVVYCEEKGLDAAISPWPSWEFPGRTLLLELKSLAKPKVRAKGTAGQPRRGARLPAARRKEKMFNVKH